MDFSIESIAWTTVPRTVLRMIEGTVILVVSLLAGLLFVGTRVMAQNARKNPAAELARLHESLAWHEARLLNAQQKGWDQGMIGQIRSQVDETRARLAVLKAGQTSASPQNRAS